GCEQDREGGGELGDRQVGRKPGGLEVRPTESELLADERQEGHEAGAFDGVLDGALKGGAVAAALAAEKLTLAGAHLLETLHVLVIDEGRPRAPVLGAEPAAVLAAATQLLPNHSRPRFQTNRTAAKE